MGHENREILVKGLTKLLVSLNYKLLYAIILSKHVSSYLFDLGYIS